MSHFHTVSRRQLLSALFGLGTFILARPVTFLLADETNLLSDKVQEPLIHTPDDRQQWSRWKKELNEWRIRARQNLHYDDSRYTNEAEAWWTKSFNSCFLMLYDETFLLLIVSVNFLVLQEFLGEAREKFGCSTNCIFGMHILEIVNSPQKISLDFYIDMRGGLMGVREIVERCHKWGVRLSIVYKKAVGHRNEAGKSHQLR